MLGSELSWVSIASERLQHSAYPSSTEIYKDILATADRQELQLQELILDVATSFISHGGPSHRIQPVVEALGGALDTPTTVYSMNTHTMLSFSPKGRRGPSAIYMINKRGSMNFTKLPHVFKLVKDMIREPQRISGDNIYEELKRIEEMENAWGQYAIAASYIPAAATSAIMFFGGDWKDAAMSGALAIIPALLLLVANKWERLWVCTSIQFLESPTDYSGFHLQWTYECIACFLVSLVATAVSKHFCYSTLILSAPVTLLPGYTVSISVVEIMTKNTVAGCIRLCYTVVYLCCMVLGLTIAPILFNAPGNTNGDGFQKFPLHINATCDTARGIVVNKFWLILCVPIYICAYNVYLKVLNSLSPLSHD